MKQIKQVEEFQKTFKQPIGEVTNLIPHHRGVLRYNLMKEENEEYLEAIHNRDIIEIADALGDMLYILCGNIIEHGMQEKIVEVFDEIHRSNMSKLDEDGKLILREDGKILKGKNYFKPDIRKIMNLEEANKQLSICFCGNKGTGESCDDSCKIVEKGED